MRKNNQETINSVTRSINVLKVLSDGLERVSDISTSLHLSHATVFRLLKTLENTGLVMQNSSNRSYHIGPLFSKIASRPDITHYYLISASLEEMNKLWESTGETVAIHISYGLHRLCLKEIQSIHKLRFVTGEGIIAPLYPGVVAKVLLAQLDEERVGKIMKHMTISSATEKTIIDKTMLLKVINKARKDGYATSDEEMVTNAMGLAAPIENYFCPAALSIVAPVFRLKPVVNDVLPQIIDAAKKISKKLKHII